jgi:MoaA/NifB/PqqE/SkfB family radical SAM enzyme
MISLQIETTSRCTLKCPACSRTEFNKVTNKPYPNYDIDPDILYNFLNCNLGKEIDTLFLCGDYGDSIYYPKLFYFLEKFKPTKNIILVTNGSHRNEKFWNELCSRLDCNDTIVFSVDGWDHESNIKYRINSDWDSIMLGIDIVAKHNIKLEWETNIFSFNYNYLDKIKQIAESKGAAFICKKTGRFGENFLRPPKDNLIDINEIYNSSYSLPDPNLVIVPQCEGRRRNSIMAQHYFVPCGWISSPRSLYKSQVWKNKDAWSIIDKTLDDLQENTLTPWVESIKNNMSTCETICKMKCKEGQLERIIYDM